jgi:hypothetical protein
MNRQSTRAALFTDATKNLRMRAETYFLVGDALGKGMVKLLATPAK